MIKNKENIFKLIVLALLMITAIFCINYLSVNDNFYNRMLEQRKEESFSGVITDKFIDKSEHSTPILKLNNSTEISLENVFWDQVEIGDSIVKKKDESYITLYHNNNVKQVFDYADYFSRLIEESKNNK